MAIKLGTVLHAGQEKLAVWNGGQDVFFLSDPSLDMVSLIETDEAKRQSLIERSLQSPAQAAPLSAVKVMAPIRRFRRDILCTGWNYWDHFYESEGKREGQDVPKPDAPTFFTKAPSVVIGPYDDIAFDAAISQKWDYEAEIVVVIGKTGRSIPQEKARDHIFGFCLANDVSQRDLQRRHGGQWFKGKSIDQTMPLGPWITLRNDLDIRQVRLECELNGKLMQNASASEMAFPIEELISELSFGMTLYAGDVLLTGTPSGIGNARTPPVFMSAGDQVTVRATGLGELVNRLASVDLKSYLR